MKLRNKIKLLVFLILTVATMVPALFVSLAIRQEALEDSTRIQTEEEGEVRTSLTDLVETAFTTLEGQYWQFASRKYQEENYGVVAKAFIEQLSIIQDTRAQRVKAGLLKMEEARAQALEEFRRLRFGGPHGYVWVQDLGTPTPRIIMHPTMPELEGKLATDSPEFLTAGNRGANLFVEAATTARSSKDGGFLDYLVSVPLPDGKRLERIPKLAFVKHLPDWDWVIGCGIPLDRIIEDGKDYLIDSLKSTSYQNGAGTFWLCTGAGEILLPANAGITGTANATESAVPYVAEARKALEGKNSAFFELQVTNPLTGKEDRHVFHVRRFEPLDWIIGTSLNAAAIEARIRWAIEEGNTKVWKLCLALLAFTVALLLLSLWLVTTTLHGYRVYSVEEKGPQPSPRLVTKAEAEATSSPPSAAPPAVPEADQKPPTTGT